MMVYNVPHDLLNKALAALVNRSSLNVGLENGPELGCKYCFI